MERGTNRHGPGFSPQIGVENGLSTRFDAVAEARNRALNRTQQESCEPIDFNRPSNQIREENCTSGDICRKSLQAFSPEISLFSREISQSGHHGQGRNCSLRSSLPVRSANCATVVLSRWRGRLFGLQPLVRVSGPPLLAHLPMREETDHAKFSRRRDSRRSDVEPRSETPTAQRTV